MKTQEKELARKLRSEGLAINEIAKQVRVSKGSISIWVRDVILTEDQKSILLKKNPAYNRQSKGAKIRKEKALEVRKQYQNSGREMARKKDPDFNSLCMLYWAEGAKSRCSLKIANTDPVMLKWFINTLRKYFSIDDSEFSLRTQWYSNNGVSFEEMQKYWVEYLQLPSTVFRKCQVDMFNKYSQKKRINKHLYGTCCVSINRTDILQNIYGAIQEITGVEKPEWIL